MAETNVPKTHRHVTAVTIKDNAAANTYSIPLRGSLTYQAGGFAEVDIKDYDGSFTGVSPTKGEEQFTTLTINATQRGLAGQAADVTLTDFIDNAGLVASTWVSTGSETSASAGDLIKVFDITVTITDHTGTATYTFPDCTFIGSSLNSSLDGNAITFSAKSRAPYPTVAFA
tara:strand:+ start:711 stop:1226 length:516 start_codon:yes stop_codon:yes gene_type:complete